MLFFWEIILKPIQQKQSHVSVLSGALGWSAQGGKGWGALVTSTAFVELPFLEGSTFLRAEAGAGGNIQLLTLWVLLTFTLIVRWWQDYGWFTANPCGVQCKLLLCKLLPQPKLHVVVLHFSPLLLEEIRNTPVCPWKTAFVPHKTWLGCFWFPTTELPALCWEVHSSRCAQDLPSRLMPLGGGTSSVFPGCNV